MPLPPELPITEEGWNRTPPAVQAVVIALWQQVQALQAQVAALQAEVAQLREQVGRNSQNSSRRRRMRRTRRRVPSMPRRGASWVGKRDTPGMGGSWSPSDKCSA
jgi:hypothetical protein